MEWRRLGQEWQWSWAAVPSASRSGVEGRAAPAAHMRLPAPVGAVQGKAKRRQLEQWFWFASRCDGLSTFLYCCGWTDDTSSKARI